MNKLIWANHDESIKIVENIVHGKKHFSVIYDTQDKDLSDLKALLILQSFCAGYEVRSNEKKRKKI